MVRRKRRRHHQQVNNAPHHNHGSAGMSGTSNRNIDSDDLSPAQAYAQFKAEQVYARSATGTFEDSLPFVLDDFQREACQALESGRGVLVAAPTGSGKTVVGEFGVYLARKQKMRAFYTTPIKALSNQKFHDFCAVWGEDNVGLLTGDNSIRPDAPIIVMTTEVLRNMIYADPARLDGLSHVILDEVHYLADRFRGPVWEEVIIHLPERIDVICLSATVSNAEDFGDWLAEVRGDCKVVVSEQRPVPLSQHMIAKNRFFDLYSPGKKSKINPELRAWIESIHEDRHDEHGRSGARAYGGGGMRSGRDKRQRQGKGRNRDNRDFHRGSERFYHKKGRSSGSITTRRSDVIKILDRRHLTPAIVFVFSRAGCDQAAMQLLHDGIVLTTPEEQDRIIDYIDPMLTHIPTEDWKVLRIDPWVRALEAGIASHHAGLLPIQKEMVEHLFVQGLVKVVYATETLSLGINMPARSVVLESLRKFNGIEHVRLTPGEYTQLTGRAGRRGIDREGHAVVVYDRRQDPTVVSALASKRTYPLNSAFRPTYNMVTNLLTELDRSQARHILERSFAQYQADSDVVALARKADRLQKKCDQTSQNMVCEHGDVKEYMQLRIQWERERNRNYQAAQSAQRQRVKDVLNQLRPGDVITYRYQHKVIFEVVAERYQHSYLTVIGENARVHDRQKDDFHLGVAIVGHIDLEDRQFRKPRDRAKIASQLRHGVRQGQFVQHHDSGDQPQSALQTIENEMHAHPVAQCVDLSKHIAASQTWKRYQRQLDKVLDDIDKQTSTLGMQFDQVCQVLQYFSVISDDDVTEAGALLRRIYSERDLLIWLVLQDNILDDLPAPQLAGLLGALVCDDRGREFFGDLPPGIDLKFNRIAQTYRELTRYEGSVGAEATPWLAWDVCRPLWLWAQGANLEDVLADSEMSAGDFVRVIQQTLDMFTQLRHVIDYDSPLGQQCEIAMGLLKKGVVAWADL